MIVQLGKQYKSKGGEDAVVLSVSGPDIQHPVVVAYQNPKTPSLWRYDSVTERGTEYLGSGSKNDLVEPQVTVRRVLEMTGTQEWIDALLSKSIVAPQADYVTSGGTITEVERTVIK